MIYKAGVITTLTLHEKISGIIDELDALHKRIVGREALCTSALDGVHGRGSLHYQGKALDLRSKDIPRDKKHKLLEAMRLAFPGYDIILEHEGGTNEHYHLEFDPK